MCAVEAEALFFAIANSMRRNELIRMHSLEPHISIDLSEWHVSHVYVCLRFGSFDFFRQQRMQVVAALVMRGLCPRRILKMQIICFQVVLWYVECSYLASI